MALNITEMALKGLLDRKVHCHRQFGNFGPWKSVGISGEIINQAVICQLQIDSLMSPHLLKLPFRFLNNINKDI